ncbi:MAG: primosomal protein N', partial [Bacteroidota bacterium]|nr:primosomal protein N' [Bacteroidota bacterium]
VSGRAGRKGKKGLVIIQTGNPSQGIFQKVIENDYLALYEFEIQERRKFNFPPFMRVIKITVKHVDEKINEQAAAVLAKEFTARLPKNQVLGPEVPYIFKIRNYYLSEIHIKLDREHTSLKAAKLLIAEAINQLKLNKDFRNIRVVADVDPV